MLLVVDGHLGHQQLLVGIEAALETCGGRAAACLPLLIEVGELCVSITLFRPTTIENGVDVAVDGVAGGVRDRLELVEELGVEGEGYSCFLGY